MKQSPPQEFAQPGQNSNSKWISWGIRERIAAAFVLVSVITLGTGLVATLSYDNIDRSLKNVEDAGLLVTEHAFSITGHTAQSARDYSFLLSSTNIGDFTKIRKLVHTEFSNLRIELATLKNAAAKIENPPNLVELEKTVQSLTDSLAPITNAIERKIRLANETRELNKHARNSYRALTNALIPFQHGHNDISSQPKLAKSITSAQRKEGTSDTQLDHTELQEANGSPSTHLEELFSEIHFEVDAANAILNQAAQTLDKDLLPTLVEKFKITAQNARRALARMGDSRAAEKLKPKLEDFFSAAIAQPGLFSVMQSQLSLADELSGLVDRNRNNIESLVVDTENAARLATLQSIGSIQKARASIAVSRSSISVLVLSSFLFSLLFAWHYVGKGVIRRLARINDATHELATGNLDVQVPHTDAEDEIEEIASALEVFKANARATKELEIEKEKARLLDLQGREASFRFLFKRNPIPMWVYEIESKKFLSINESAINHYGYSRDEFLTKTIYALRSSDNKSTPEEFERGMRYGTSRSDSSTHVTACGNLVDVVTYCREFVYEGKKACLVAAIDMTERNQAQARVAHMALHDSLTKLANRNKFSDHLEHALDWIRRNKGEGIAVHWLDLDKFKVINDTLGHATGDAVLIMVAERLKKCVREIDTVARMGGDEFAIIQRQVKTDSGPHALAQRIVSSLREPFEVNGVSVTIGASVGISQAPADGTNPEQLLKNADLALYSAKGDGRGNYHFFNEEMGTQLQERQKLEFDIKSALENDEISLAFQPYFSVETNETLALEALLRWRHPEKGTLEAKDFIPLARETGHVVAIGNWALKEACKQAASWPEDKKLAISITNEQLRSSDLHSVVVDALQSSNLPPQRLELEIAESIAALNVPSIVDALNNLKRKGVGFTMDNFCNGQSTLDQVRRFRFDKVKIDSTFINTIVDTGDGVNILRAIIKLANSMEFEILAKEIATVDQLNIIRSEGCAEMQGALFSEPMSGNQVEKFLARRFATIRGAA